MAVTNGYATLDALKGEIGITDLEDDILLERAIEAASRWIDRKAGTRFYTTTSDETRYYSLSSADAWNSFLCPDDILSVTTLATDDGSRTYPDTWAATDYDLLPYQAGIAGRQPYTWIETTPEGNYTFTFYRRGIKIIGKFGYCAAANLPPEVNRACLLMAQRLFRRKDAVFGVAGLADLGQIQLQIPADPDVLNLLAPHIQRYRGPY